MHFFAEPEVWVLLAVVVFVIGVWKPARRVILGGLDARAARIRDELETARRLRDEAEEALAGYRKQQREAGPCVVVSTYVFPAVCAVSSIFLSVLLEVGAVQITACLSVVPPAGTSA